MGIQLEMSGMGMTNMIRGIWSMIFVQMPNRLGGGVVAREVVEKVAQKQTKRTTPMTVFIAQNMCEKQSVELQMWLCAGRETHKQTPKIKHIKIENNELV